ncbi:MAG: ABC transporter ATP-binding protein [Mariprofundaceae bacterium]
MTTVIKIENMSKRYIIGHQKQERYTSLRDVMMHKLRGLGERIRHPLSLNREEIDIEEFWALRDINLEVSQGDRLGIIGRNGAGKSTLLKVLSRITEPTKGRISIKGRIASLLEVGTGFHPELTGKENIFLNGAILGMTNSEIKKKFDEIVVFAEVEKFLDTPVKRYSSGMYIRLAFAVAAHLEPEILVVDEVLAVGDAQFQKKCLGKMEQVGREGRTVLFVSHNLGAIRSLCSRAIQIEHGMVAMDDLPSEVTATYLAEKQSESAKRFIEMSHNEPLLQIESASVKKVEICKDDGSLAGEIFTDTAFNVAIYYEITRDDASVGLTLIIYDADNHCVLGSINNHEKDWYGKPMPRGTYKSVCQIPKNFFNNGFYSLSLSLFGKGFSGAVVRDNLLTVEILDGSEVRRDYYGHYASCTRPLFNWSTVKEE